MSLTSQLITVKNIFYKGISGFIQCLDFLGKMSGFFPKNVWIYPDVVWIFSEKLWGPMKYGVPQKPGELHFLAKKWKTWKTGTFYSENND